MLQLETPRANGGGSVSGREHARNGEASMDDDRCMERSIWVPESWETRIGKFVLESCVATLRYPGMLYKQVFDRRDLLILGTSWTACEHFGLAPRDLFIVLQRVVAHDSKKIFVCLFQLVAAQSIPGQAHTDELQSSA